MTRALVKTIGQNTGTVQIISSDTISFVQKFSAINTSTDAVGTFNVYTYGSASDTATLVTNSGTPIAQSTSSINTNGIQLFTRIFNSASTATSPARVDIYIGKGLKSVSFSIYKNTGKSVNGSVDNILYSSTRMGITFKEYNDVTGILTLDAGWDYSSSAGAGFLFQDSIINPLYYTSGYVVFNALKIS